MARLIMSVLLALGSLAAADVLDWYPLQVGRRWVYHCVTLNGDPQRPDVAEWTARFTVREHIATPEGLVVLRSLEIEGAPNPPRGRPWHSVPLLVRDNCLYPLYDMWDERNRGFKCGFRRYLEQISPSFCFPLKTGARWKGTGDWEWVVEGTGPGDTGVKGVTDAFRLKSRQSGSIEYVWFRKGAGPVVTWSWHNGAYTEAFDTLQPEVAP